MMAEANTEFVATLEEVAASRGLTLAEVCEATRPDPSSNRRVTPRRLERGGFGGCGVLLDRVLNFTEEERGRVARGWAHTFLASGR
jgi:hypothetical protein